MIMIIITTIKTVLRKTVSSSEAIRIRHKKSTTTTSPMASQPESTFSGTFVESNDLYRCNKNNSDTHTLAHNTYTTNRISTKNYIMHC